MIHNFDVKIAEQYGIFEAVIINHLWFWIKKNEANEQNYYDGKYWTYNSMRAFQKLFPYATERQIRYAIDKLKKEGVIQTGNYNKSAYDRTLWYAFTDFGISILQKSEIDLTILSNQNSEIVKPIPYINTDNKTDNKTNIYTKDLPKKTVKDKKETVDTIIKSFSDNQEVINTLFDFKEQRKNIKAPLTTLGTKKLLTQLKNITTDPEEQIEIINNSIAYNWKGFFPLKNKPKKSNVPPELREILKF